MLGRYPKVVLCVREKYRRTLSPIRKAFICVLEYHGPGNLLERMHVMPNVPVTRGPLAARRR
jgi:hypothetical protein